MLELVSIITPCYNSDSYIRETIQSVLCQTYTNWELIIVDDCSSDDSEDIINEYKLKDNRIKYYKTEKPSGGPTIPRNIAINQAKGRYIAFLDSDDIWLPTKLKSQLDVLQNEPGAAVVYSFYEKINEIGQRDGRVVKSPQRISYKELLYGNVIGNLTGMYDTEKVGKITLKNVKHEDFVLWLEILKQGYYAINTNTVEALYRVRKSSVSSNKFKALSWTWNIYRNIENISIFTSLFYFMCYAIKAAYKKIK